MWRRLLLTHFAVLGLAATTMASAGAQSLAGLAGSVIHDAGGLAARIRAYHRGPGIWTGMTPPPPDYCDTMRAGEFVLKELARLSSRAILYRQPGLALRLQAAADRLSDELDEEEMINNLAGIPYQVFPCPVPASPYPARAYVLPAVERRMPFCRVQADALRVSFEPRRARMEPAASGLLSSALIRAPVNRRHRGRCGTVRLSMLPLTEHRHGGGGGSRALREVASSRRARECRPTD